MSTADRLTDVVTVAVAALLKAGRPAPERTYVFGGQTYVTEVGQITCQVVDQPSQTERQKSCGEMTVNAYLEVWRALDGRYFPQGVVAPVVDVDADDLDQLGRETLADFDVLAGLSDALMDVGVQMLPPVPVGSEGWGGVAGVRLLVSFPWAP